MKQKMLMGLTVVAAAALLTGCDDSVGSTSEKQGRIFPTVSVNADVISSENAQSGTKSRASMGVDPSQLAIDLNSADGSVVRHWDSLDQFPTGEDWAVGAYTMEASYGSLDEEGINKPYYYGRTEFTVKDSETTPVKLTAQLANSMVTVSYTENFKKYFQTYSLELLTAGNNRVAYPADAAGSCYVKPGSVTLSLNVRKFNGTEATLTPASFTAEARHHYRLSLDVATGSGDGMLVLQFDEMLAKEDVTVDLSDELLNAPAPTLTPTGFQNGQVMNFITGAANTQPINVTLLAHGGIASLVMKTVSPTLIEQGWPAEIDLAAGESASAAPLESLGLKTVGLKQNPDKMARVDLTGVPQHLDYTEGTDNVSAFTFVARDKYGKVSDELTVSFSLEPLVLNISEPSVIYDGQDRMTFSMSFNGGSTDNLKVQYRGSNGQWNDTEATVSAASRATENYSVSAAIPSAGEVSVSVLFGKHRSNELKVSRTAAPFSVIADVKDVFATRAAVTLIDNGASSARRKVMAKATDASRAQLQYSTNGRDFANATATLSGSTWTVTGLQPSTNYTFRAVIDKINSGAATFTTEAATQLTNGNFETEPTIDGSASHWENYVFQGWGTNNPMTTSQGSNYAYVRISGTKPTTEAHSGSAVCISTQGWGSGNTAIGTAEGGSVCKYIDAGLLHLGSSRTTRPSGFSDRTGTLETTDLDCGIDFASRPSAVSFWYKYAEKNSADYGLAKAYVYDAAGNVIAQGTADLVSAGSYVQKSIPLTYAQGAAKAAKIYICFLSTHSTDFLAKSNDYLNAPAFANLSRGEYYGSRLYLDDVTLDY